MWKTGLIPAGWKHAVVLPFVKPGKDPLGLSVIRPIALTSNMLIDGNVDSE